jgi:hypothetical protein
MKLYLLTILFTCLTLVSVSQTGSVELSSGGFSFIPAFTSKEPNIILNAGTNPAKKFTSSIMFMTRVRSMTPNTVVIMSRYKLINKKFKTIIGVHLPAMQLTKDYQVTSFFGQELTTSYTIHKSWNVGTFLLHGKGRNSDFEAWFMAANAFYSKDKWGLLSQTYYLDQGNLTGIAETLTYDINKKFQAKAFGNYTFTDGSIIATIGLKYNL